MRKIVCLAEYTIYIVLLNIVVFFLRPMDFTVTNFSWQSLNSIGWLNSLSNLLIYLITIFIISLFFKSERLFITYGDFFKRFALFGLLPCIGVRLTTDFIVWFISCLPPVLLSYAYSAKLIIEAASLFITFKIIKKAVGGERIKRNRGENIICIVGVLLMIITAAYYFVLLTKSIQISEYISRKFLNPDMQIIYNYDFYLQLTALAFSIILWVTLFAYFGFFGSYVKRNAENYKLTTFFARILSIGILLPTAYAIKATVLPQNTLVYFSNQSSPTVMLDGMVDSDSAIPHANDSTGFDAAYNISAVYRGAPFGSDKSTNGYVSATVYYQYQKRTILKFNRPYSTEHGYIYEINANGVDVARRFEFDAVAYQSGNDIFAIKMSDINGYDKEDKPLINVMESLVSDGYFEAFEYSYKYLLKYDKDFILPYIDEYSADVLSYELAEKNDYITPDYIKDFSKQIVIG